MTLMFDISFLLQLKKIKKLKLGGERRFLCLLKICFCHLFSCVGLLSCKRGFFFNLENGQLLSSDSASLKGTCKPNHSRCLRMREGFFG